ncbi:hypothetical protein [Aeromonas tecta]|uniref:hypothetical protein n=1 Tax=Aeromonas tecta TaxID=324617 RepID=UPI00067FEA51|nr:hypothetical protein [Aeromonas tecta]
MAGKKVKTLGDNKSEQLAAAAVGAGTDLVQAQSEPKKDGEVLVDPEAEAARLEAEAKAAEGQGDDQGAANAIGASNEPGANLSSDVLTAEQLPAGVNEEGLTLEGIDASAATLILGVEANQSDWLLGQFDVKAKSPAGFWRCGVQFLHSSPTRVFVVNSKADVPADHDCSVVCCYLTLEEARRVHSDQWLTVVLGSEVIKE